MDDELLTPANLDARPTPPGPRGPRLPVWVAALLLLVVGLGGILWFRTRLPAPPPPPVRPTPTPEPTPDPGLRLDAEMLLNDLIAAVRELRPLSPELWAEAEWESILTGQQSGNAFLAQRKFPEASAMYQETLHKAEWLLSQRALLPGRLRDLAWTAYSHGRGDTAVRLIDVWLGLQPGTPEAMALRPRAELATQSFEALQHARSALAAEMPEQAWLVLEQTRDLDPAFPGRTEVEAGVRTALDLNRGQATLQEEYRLQQLEQARSLESAENWSGAIEAWLRIREQNPDAVPEGKVEELQRFGEWQERIRRADGERNSLQAREVETELTTGGMQNLPPGLQQQAKAFLEAMRLQRQPVRVRLRSDAETEVLVQRVRRLAPFVETELRLLPGNYVAIGSRLGYRDVRREFTVPPGAEEVLLEIRATESIRDL